MIKEEYVTWDTAKLLKETGYPQTADYINVPAEYLVNPVRPTQSQAMRWLREHHRLNIEILVTTNGKWIWQISCTANGESVFPHGCDLPLDVCETYEGALEHAVLKAIEIIKSQKQ